MFQNIFFRLLLRLIELPLRVRLIIKKKLYINGFQKVGSNFLFSPLDSVFPVTGTTQVGDNVFINSNAYWGGVVCVGNNVMISSYVSLIAGDHIFAVRGISPRFINLPDDKVKSQPIVIEDEVWIGVNVTVLGNVTVGIGSVVGAGSVVVRDVCPYTVSVGNPCHPVKRIFDDDTLLLHLQEIGYSESFAAEVVERRKIFLKNVNIPLIDNTDIHKLAIQKWNQKS